MEPTHSITRRTALKTIGAATLASGAVSTAAADPRNFYEEMAEVRAATAEYTDPATAYADGYVAAGQNGVIPLENVTGAAHAVCGMGFHFGKRDNMGSVDVTEPAVLVYGVDENGDLVLGGVEYIVPKAGPYEEEAPDIFEYDIGSEFWAEDSPTEGLWALHAWVHTKNPNGYFAPFNPREEFLPDGCTGGH